MPDTRPGVGTGGAGRGKGMAPDQSQADPFAQAESALKKLRQHPGDKEAADTLGRALEQLKERSKSQAPTDHRPKE
jgi:hypothetical protein